MARFALFGGTGFIGTNVCRSLVLLGHSVVTYGTSDAQGASAGVTHRAFDIADLHDLSHELSDVDIAVHLVSTMLPSPSNADPIRDVEENLVGSLRLIDAVRHSAVRRLIFISSGGTVYGAQESMPVREAAPAQPLCSYGIVKRSIEQYLALYRHLYGLDYFALRVGNPYGPFQVPGGQGLVANVIARALRSEPVVIWGDGSVVRDYIYIDDVVSAVVGAAFHEGRAGERVLNIGSGVGRSVLDVVSSIEDLMGAPIERQFKDSRPSDVPANVLDISLAREILDWRPTTQWQSGLVQTRDWLASSPH